MTLRKPVTHSKYSEQQSSHGHTFMLNEERQKGRRECEEKIVRKAEGDAVKAKSPGPDSLAAPGMLAAPQ